MLIRMNANVGALSFDLSDVETGEVCSLWLVVCVLCLLWLKGPADDMLDVELTVVRNVLSDASTGGVLWPL